MEGLEGMVMVDCNHTPDLIRLHEKTMADTAEDVAGLRKDFMTQTDAIKQGIHRIETQTLEKLVGGVAQEAAQATAVAKSAHSRIDLLDGKFKYVLGLVFGGSGIVALAYFIVELLKGKTG
jgi:hypothetical protein